VRICIPSRKPGGPDSVISNHFDEMEMIDYYDISPYGTFDHSAQTAYCGGGCFDVVEAMIRRGIDSVVVNGISPSTLQRFRAAGVRVLKADQPHVGTLITSFISGQLKEFDRDQATRI